MLIALSTRFVKGQSKSLFSTLTMEVYGGKKLSSLSFSISGFLSGKGGDGGISQNKGFLRLLYLRSNSSSLHPEIIVSTM